MYHIQHCTKKTTGILNYSGNFLIKLFYVSFRFKYVRATGTSMSCFVYHTMSIKVVERVHCNLKQVFCHATQVQSIWYRNRKLFRRWRLGKTCSGNSTHFNSTLSNFCFWILWQISILPRLTISVCAFDVLFNLNVYQIVSTLVYNVVGTFCTF